MDGPKGPVDFISLTLKNAMPIFKFNLGTGTATLKVRVKKELWHKVYNCQTMPKKYSSRITFYLFLFVTELICPVEIIADWLTITRILKKVVSDLNFAFFGI